MVKVAILGYGTVGSGVATVIEENNALISNRIGDDIEVKYILDLREFPGDPNESKVVHDINIIVEDPEVSVVCETMGGVGAAYAFTKNCLEKGKSVCTSNKELVAKHGPELLKMAADHDCSYFFEASVGGAIPIIRPIESCLTAEKVERILGILNGTTNYMLTKMEREGADYATVLKEAQDLGYAERNPEADVEGHDACRKIAILSSLMLRKNIDSENIPTEGITKITAEDFKFANEAGYTIKILGVSEAVSEEEARVYVSPLLIPLTHPIAMVNDVFNAIFVTGNMLGDCMFYGKGAGKLPTASAVVADVVKAAKHIGKNVRYIWEAKDAKLASLDDVKRKFFIRTSNDYAAEVQELIPYGVAIDNRKVPTQFGYITPEMTEAEFAAVAAKLGDKMLGRLRVHNA